MALTKTQIYYLENKLDKVVNEKKTDFIKKLGGTSLEKEILKRLKIGKVKLLSKAELLSVFEKKISVETRYHQSFGIQDFISETDRQEIETEIQGKQAKINDYSNKLSKVKSDILDKIVLEGIDIDTAFAELENIQ